MTTSITVAITKLRESWASEFGYTPRQINNGDCMEFVNELFLEFELESDCRRMDTNDLPETVVTHESGFDTEPYHMWVTDGDLHYDAEVPYGVRSWSDLPFFQRTLGC